MARHNWEQIKKEYVEGIKKGGQLIHPSQAEISAKYNIDPATICRKAKKDQWDVQKEIMVNKISTKRQEKKAEVISDEGSQFDLDCFNAAKKGMDKVQAMIDKQALPEDINKLSAALKNFQAVGKVSLGDKDSGSDTVKIKVTLVDDNE
jgi:hypothetical protein